MRLTLAVHTISGLALGSGTRLDRGMLTVGEAELRQLILEDGRIEDVRLEAVRPGENCRIGGVVDVIEPRAKAPGDGNNFPGALEPMALAGRGTTHVLRGMAVVLLGEGNTGTLIEMTGQWAQWCPFAALHNLVVIPRVRPDLPRHMAMQARKLAGLKAAAYLAQAAGDTAPDASEVYESDGPSQARLEGVPRMAYIGQVHSRQTVAEIGEPIVYGHNTNGMLPGIFHPNEWLDGAILAGGAGMNVVTYFHQNHPVITELYRWQAEGKIRLVGTIATTAAGANFDRELNCTLAAELTKWNLGADAAVLTKTGGGAPHADMGYTAKLLEDLGVRTAVMVGPPNLAPERTVESATLFNYPEVDAIVFNSGGALFELPAAAVERVVAPSPEAAEPLFTPATLAASRVCGVTSQQGAQRLRTFVY
jgi:glycine reductase